MKHPETPLAEPRPRRLVFMPSGLDISCRGLTAWSLRRIADRWGCDVRDARRSPPQAEVIVRSLSQDAIRRARARPIPPADRPFEQRFGGWKVSIPPGAGKDLVESTAVEGPKSSRFAEAVDLCVTHLLALQGGAVLHAAAFEIEGTGVLAVGGSGCGKSTVAVSALRVGGLVVSDDVVLAARTRSGRVEVTPLRRALVLREGGLELLPEALHGQLQSGRDERTVRWQLPATSAPAVFAARTSPQIILLLSVDRRLRSTKVVAVDQATALTWMIRATEPRFLKAPFDAEREAVLDVLVALAENASCIRVRLGPDLLDDPDTIVRGLCAAGAS